MGILDNIFGSNKPVRHSSYKSSMHNSYGSASRIGHLKPAVLSKVSHGGNKRAFEMAKTTRLTAGFMGVQSTVNWDIRMGLIYLRQKSRELAENDPLARKFLRTMEKNVIGPNGFVMRNEALKWEMIGDEQWQKTIDSYANGLIEEDYWLWTRKKYCTLGGDVTMRQFCKLILRQRLVDGEIFLKKVYQNKKVNPFGYTIQPIEAHFCDENLNKKLPNGNIIVMGIELNELRQKVAYWFLAYKVEDELSPMGMQRKEYVRIPADQIIHYYSREFTDQLRGIPTFVAVGNRLYNLKAYQDNALVNAKSSACKVNMLEPVVGEEEEEVRDPDTVNHSDIEVEDGEVLEVTNVTPGMTYVIPQGYKHVAYDPAYPQQEYGPYTNSVKQEVASGLVDIPHHILSSNLSDVNYTSSRVGTIDARIGTEDIQSDMIEDVLEPTFADYLEMAFLLNRIDIKLPDGSNPITKFDRFNAPRFYGYIGELVDPLKETTAALKGIEGNIELLEDHVRKKGRTLEEFLDKKAYEIKAKKERGIFYNDVSVPDAAFVEESNNKNKGNGND